MARAARLPLILVVAVLAGCGGEGDQNAAPADCRVQGSDANFPLLDPKKPHTVDVLTNQGSFAIRLAVDTSPCMTSSFAALVRRKFFDGTTFHRIVPGFVIQGGDPTGTGTGGPGYTVVEAPPRNSLYTQGVVAMAKSEAEPAGAGGSQFFIVTGGDAGLPPQYAVLGVITRGLRVIERIGLMGDPTTEKPTRRIVVLRMVVT